jgi:hypothetical protein
VLDAKYVLDGPTRPEAFTLVADRRWKLLVDGESTATVEVADDSPDRQAIRSNLAAGAAGRAEAVLRFRWHQATLPGNLRLPAIEPASLPVVQRWLAVSNSGELECEIAGAGSSAPRSVDEFLTAWSGKNGAADPARSAPDRGQSADAPSQSATMTDNAPSTGWRVAVRPRRTALASDDVLQVAAGRERLRMHFRADVKPGPLQQFQLALRVPADLTIERLSLSEAGISLPVRWVRRSDRDIQVFFGKKIAEPFRLVLTGHTPVESAQKAPFPSIALAGRDGPTRVWLYRDNDLAVDLAIKLSGAVELLPSDAAPVEPPPTGWLVQPVGCYQLTRGPAESAWLTITADEPAAHREAPATPLTSNPPPRPTLRAAAAAPSERPSAGVRLADTVVLVGPAGDRIASTRFALAASGLAECQIDLPADDQLLLVDIDGRPAKARPLSARRWAVELGPAAVPQIVEVVSRSIDRNGTAATVDMTRPALFANRVPLAIEISLWTIARPRGGGRLQIGGASQVAAAEQSALRIERLVSFAEGGMPAVLALSATDQAAWFGNWAAYLASLRQQAPAISSVAHASAGTSQLAAAGDEPLGRALQRLDGWLAKWGETGTGAEWGRGGEGERGRFDGGPFVDLSAAALDWTYCVADGASNRLSIERSNSSAAGEGARTVGLLAIVGATVGALWLSRRTAAKRP